MTTILIALYAIIGILIAIITGCTGIADVNRDLAENEVGTIGKISIIAAWLTVTILFGIAWPLALIAIAHEANKGAEEDDDE